MIIKEVKHIQDGDILASPVLTEEKEILLEAGTVLKKEYAELLFSMYISYVEVLDPYEKYEVPHMFFTESEKEYFIHEIEIVLEKHIYTDKNTLRYIKKLSGEIQSFVSGIDKNQIYDYRNRKTNLYEHTLMVTVLSLIISEKLNFDKERKEEVALGCLLHDLGLRYITVPYLNLDMEKLSPGDVFEFKKHTILAYTVLDGQDDWFPKISKSMVLSHHERKDGSGYPLKQRRQNLECEIIQLCDFFDCMISGFEEKIISVDKAMDRLDFESGSKFDKELFHILCSMISKYPVGTKVKLSNEKYGVVVNQTNHREKPVIHYLTGAYGNIIENDICNLEKTTGIFIENVIE